MKKNQLIKILIAEDHSLVRTGFVKLLEEVPEFHVIGETDNGNDLVKLYFLKKPDIVISDISMPLFSGFDAAKAILQEDPEAKRIFLSMFDSDEYAFRAYKVGAKGLISKNILKGELAFAIKKVIEGSIYFGNWNEENINELLKKFNPLDPSNITLSINSLSLRERQLLELIAEGLTNAEIAEKLEIAKKTVLNIRGTLMAKLNVSSLPALMKIAYEFSSKNLSKE